MLEFDEAKHLYTWSGKPVPSVTQVLAVLGGYEGIPAEILRRAAERGTAVHRATEDYDKGTLNWGEVSDEVYGYLSAWQEFRDRVKPEILEIEGRDYHEKLGYAGTRDRIMILSGKLSVVDLKSSWKLMPATGPQTAAYAEQWNARNKDKIKKRYGLRLAADGKYELSEYKDAHDLNTFLSCLNVTKWKMKHHNYNPMEKTI